MCRMSNPRPRTSCSKVRSGDRSVGGRERKVASQLVLRLCACALPTARPNVLALPVPSTCRERKLGWWVSIIRMMSAILPLEPTGRHPDQGSCGRNQGALDLRTSTPTTQRRAGTGSLRRTILERTSPPCPDVDDGIRLLTVPTARSGGTEKKSPRPTSHTFLPSSAPSHP